MLTHRTPQLEDVAVLDDAPFVDTVSVVDVATLKGVQDFLQLATVAGQPRTHPEQTSEPTHPQPKESHCG